MIMLNHLKNFFFFKFMSLCLLVIIFKFSFFVTFFNFRDVFFNKNFLMVEEVSSLAGEVDNVKVVVRCRPLTNDEIHQGHSIAVQVNRMGKSISVINIHTKNVCF